MAVYVSQLSNCPSQTPAVLASIHRNRALIGLPHSTSIRRVITPCLATHPLTAPSITAPSLTIPSTSQPAHDTDNDVIGAELRRAAEQRQRLATAFSDPTNLQVVIDCGFIHTLQSPKELRSLAKQIQTAVGHNRRAEAPVCLQVTSWSGELAELAEGRMGAAAWPLVKHSQPTLDVHPDPSRLLVLSPDADLPQEQLPEGNRVLVVGGVVDRSVRRGLTAGFAAANGLEARRLPTLEFAEQLGLGRGVSKRPVLNICDVVLALLMYRANGGNWAAALHAAIPARKRNSGCRV